MSSSNDFLEYATKFLSLGFSLIPLRPNDKKPNVQEWSPYQSRKPTSEEILSWFEGRNDNIGIVCGEVSGNLVVLDFDDPEVFHFCYLDWQKLAERTLVVRTSKGFHVYLRTDKSVKTGRIESLRLDVKGQGSYVVAPPSLHPDGTSYCFLDKSENVLQVEWDNISRELSMREGEWPYVKVMLPHWIEGNRQNLTMGLAAFLRKHMQFDRARTKRVIGGISAVSNDVEYSQRLSAVDATYSKDVDEIAIEAWLGEELSGQLLTLCKDRTSSNSIQRKNDAPKLVREVPTLTQDDGTIIDEVCTKGQPRFIVWKNGSWEFKDAFEKDGTTHVPINDDLLRKGIVLLPSGAEEYGNEKELYLEILDFINKWVECDPTMARLMALQKMSEWLYEKMPTLPIVNPRGGSDTGKTRLGNVLWAISLRGMRADGVLSLSSLFRNAEAWKGTLYINEGDISNGRNYADNETSQLVKYYNSRYERNAAVWRTNPEDLKPQVFASFGPTILVTRKGFSDDALESRCIVVLMLGRTRRDIPLNLPPEFYVQAEKLRNKLELFRLRTLNRFSNDHSLEFPNVSTRINQILQPIASLAKMFYPELFEEIRGLAQSLSEKTVEERANSADGMIVRAYINIDPGFHGVTASDIASRISDIFGQELKPQAIGARARALGFSSRKIHGGKKRLLSVTSGLAQTLLHKYVPEDEREELATKALEAPSDPTRRSHLPLDSGLWDGKDNCDDDVGGVPPFLDVSDSTTSDQPAGRPGT